MVSGTGLLFLPPLLMIVFRQQVPALVVRLEPAAPALRQPGGRVPGADGRPLPVHRGAAGGALDFAYPERAAELNRWLPLVKWFLAIPHYVVLFLLDIGVLLAAIAAWFAILFTGRYPRGMFDYVEGVIGWHNRVLGYVVILVTDAYPPFRLRVLGPEPV